ncbi:hypothetical protein [Heliophilum fasciatum]|uniref:Uncharacterized protein n=1 Tax=Heliophilum fasciatum TaxID=35700 RepID=A0A4R2RNW2_9FIRM|nr:hypothetical protein [Heliophilum fasciatum]MCW2277991.1 hypothetical protein [Heliophilum fasciatum]TCP64389.1 hypothetical protein EDD73_11088 [Heliophilum fasciatum]
MSLSETPTEFNQAIQPTPTVEPSLAEKLDRLKSFRPNQIPYAGLWAALIVITIVATLSAYFYQQSTFGDRLLTAEQVNYLAEHNRYDKELNLIFQRKDEIGSAIDQLAPIAQECLQACDKYLALMDSEYVPPEFAEYHRVQRESINYQRRSMESLLRYFETGYPSSVEISNQYTEYANSSGFSAYLKLEEAFRQNGFKYEKQADGQLFYWHNNKRLNKLFYWNNNKPIPI